MSTNKKWIVWIIIIAVIAAAGTIYYSNLSEKENDNVVRIGAILALTGPLAQIGQDYHNAMEMAVENANNTILKNNKIEFYVEDSQGKVPNALSAFQILTEIKKCDIIIGMATDVVNSLVEPSKEKDVMLFALSVVPGITKQGKNIFRISANSFQEAEIISDYYNSKYNNIGIAYVENDFGYDVKNNLEKHLKPDMNIHSVSFEFGENEFKQFVLDLLKKNVEAVHFIGYPGEAIAFVKQFREQNKDILISGAMTFTFEAVRNAFEQKNIIFAGSKLLVDNDSKTEIYDFKDTFKNKYGKIPIWIAAFGSDNITYVAEAIKNKVIKTRDDIYNALLSTKEFKGIVGKIKLDSNRDATSDIGLLKEVDGRIVLVE